MNKPQEDRVVLTLQVRAVTDDLRKEDREIPGDYLFSVSNALPEDQRASAVLDSFHAHLPVGILDDFEFAVWYQGRLLEERDDHEEYSLQHAALLESFRSLKPEDRGARPVTEMSDGMRRSICFSAANSIQDFLNGGWDGNEEGWRVILARLRQAAGPGVEQTPDQKDTPDSIAYILIQEGGTSRELYLHGWETQEEAEQDRVNCAEHGAYRTGPVITAPKSLESHPEFYTVVEKVLGSLQDLDFGVALAEAPDDGSENNPGLRRAPAAPKF